MTETLEQTAIRLEHFETPEWAVLAILRKEILTQHVVDPCAGTGILADAARKAGYTVLANDIHDWTGRGDTYISDFLNADSYVMEYVLNASVLMNPPFKHGEAFVEKALEYGARKVVCFNRFSWWEGAYDTGAKRGMWWEKYRPNRVYVCGDRANCWRHDIPKEQRTSGTSTAHAWFVWEAGQPPGTILGHVYKGDAV